MNRMAGVDSATTVRVALHDKREPRMSRAGAAIVLICCLFMAGEMQSARCYAKSQDQQSGGAPAAEENAGVEDPQMSEETTLATQDSQEPASDSQNALGNAAGEKLIVRPKSNMDQSRSSSLGRRRLAVPPGGSDRRLSSPPTARFLPHCPMTRIG